MLPKHLTPERMTRVALTAFLKTPKLLECSPESLTNALLICSQAGLEPDGRLAHLIPYGTVVQVIFDWKGLVALGLRSGFDNIYPDIVCENDDFEASVEDGQKRLHHKVNWRKERGEPYAFYCVTMKGGILDYEIMTFDETERIREKSRAKDSGPWVTNPVEMRKKCPIRRMSKRWDLLPEIRDIINAEDDMQADIRPGLAVSKPLFEIAKPEPAAIEAGDGGGEAEQPAPPTEKGVVENATGGNFSYVRAVRGLCKMSGIGEGALLDFLAETGSTDGSVTSIEELATYDSGKVLVMVHDAWKTVAAKMKEGK